MKEWEKVSALVDECMTLLDRKRVPTYKEVPVDWGVEKRPATTHVGEFVCVRRLSRRDVTVSSSECLARIHFEGDVFRQLVCERYGKVWILREDEVERWPAIPRIGTTHFRWRDDGEGVGVLCSVRANFDHNPPRFAIFDKSENGTLWVSEYVNGPPMPFGFPTGLKEGVPIFDQELPWTIALGPEAREIIENSRLAEFVKVLSSL